MGITHKPRSMIRIQCYIQAMLILHDLMIGYDDGKIDDNHDRFPAADIHLPRTRDRYIGIVAKLPTTY